MTEQKKVRDPTLYSDLYSYRDDWLWADVKETTDLKSPKVISFFCKSGTTPITGKVKQLPEPEYKGTMDIKEGFALLKELMHTKQGNLRKTMENLRDYEEYTLIALINYMRECWVEKETTLHLTWTEYYLLRNGGFNKQNKKK